MTSTSFFTFQTHIVPYPMRILYTLYLYMYRCLNLFIAFLERVRVATERERRRLVALLTREYEGTFATQPSSFDVDWSDGYYAGGDNNSKSRSCQITSTMIPLYSRSKEIWNAIPRSLFQGSSENTFYFWYGYETALCTSQNEIIHLLEQQRQMQSVFDSYVELAKRELDSIRS
ncbi:hypothetical protein WA588_002845 [Blastocystis sp. NMH]